MKRLRHISIRMRITLMTAFLVILVAAVVTALSLYNANEQFQTIEFKVGEAFSVDFSGSTVIAGTTGIIGSYDEPIPDEDALPENAIIVISSARDAFHTQTLLILAAIIVLSVGLAWLLSGLMLRPVKQLDATVSEVSSATLSARLPAPQTIDEVGRLTQSFNHMLDRLETDFERQKQYSSAVAHELKTPLATMKATLQVANMEQKIDPDFYEITLRGIIRLSDVVTELLQLYNEDATQECAPLSLAPLLRDIAAELQKAYSEQSMQLVFEGEADVPTFSGNLVLIRRLFFNILDNAFKYTPNDGEITIRYRAGETELTVIISDSGIGIAADALPHIFEPFYRADASRARESGGSGLGLSIVKTIADSLSYTVSCTSTPEIGTSLTVTIPFSNA